MTEDRFHERLLVCGLNEDFVVRLAGAVADFGTAAALWPDEVATMRGAVVQIAARPEPLAVDLITLDAVGLPTPPRILERRWGKLVASSARSIDVLDAIVDSTPKMPKRGET